MVDRVLLEVIELLETLVSETVLEVTVRVLLESVLL